MTSEKELKRRIKASGLKEGYIAEVLGISEKTLYNKIRNVTPFKASEIGKLCELLKIKDFKSINRIFFKPDVD